MKFDYEERKISFETIDLWLRNFQDEMNHIATVSNDDEIINFLVIVDERDETAEVSIEKRELLFILLKKIDCKIL